MLYNLNTFEQVRDSLRNTGEPRRTPTKVKLLTKRLAAAKRAQKQNGMKQGDLHQTYSYRFFDTLQRVSDIALSTLTRRVCEEDDAWQDTQADGSPQYMGLEIETAMRHGCKEELCEVLEEHYSGSNTRYHVTSDVSLHTNIGFEIVSHKSTYSALHATVEQLVEAWGHITYTNPSWELTCVDRNSNRIRDRICDCDSLSNDGLQYTGRNRGEDVGNYWYGMHCHVGKGNTDLFTFKKMALVANSLFFCAEDVFREIGGRPTTRWDMSTKSSSIKSMGSIFHVRGAVAYRDMKFTLEYRFGMSLMDEQHIKTYIQLCHAMTKWAEVVVTSGTMDMYLLRPKLSNIDPQHEAMGLFNAEQIKALRVWTKDNAYDVRYLCNVGFLNWVMNQEGYDLLKERLDELYRLPKYAKLLKHKSYDKANQANEVGEEV